MILEVSFFFVDVKLNLQIDQEHKHLISSLKKSLHFIKELKKKKKITSDLGILLCEEHGGFQLFTIKTTSKVLHDCKVPSLCPCLPPPSKTQL